MSALHPFLLFVQNLLLHHSQKYFLWKKQKSKIMSHHIIKFIFQLFLKINYQFPKFSKIPNFIIGCFFPQTLHLIFKFYFYWILLRVGIMLLPDGFTIVVLKAHKRRVIEECKMIKIQMII